MRHSIGCTRTNSTAVMTSWFEFVARSKSSSYIQVARDRFCDSTAVLGGPPERFRGPATRVNRAGRLDLIEGDSFGGAAVAFRALREHLADGRELNTNTNIKGGRDVSAK